MAPIELLELVRQELRERGHQCSEMGTYGHYRTPRFSIFEPVYRRALASLTITDTIISITAFCYRDIIKPYGREIDLDLTDPGSIQKLTAFLEPLLC